MSWDKATIGVFLAGAIIGAVYWGGKVQEKVNRIQAVEKVVTELKLAIPDSQAKIDAQLATALKQLREESDRQETRLRSIPAPSAPEVTVLPLTWGHTDQVYPLFSDQAILRVGTVFSSDVSFTFVVPGNEPVKLEDVRVADPKTFSYKDRTYILHVLDFRTRREESSGVKEVQFTVVTKL